MTPRKGDLVRVTFKATFFDETYVDPGPDRLLFRLPPNATVEVIEDLRPGDVYRTASGSGLMYLPAALHDDTPWVGPCSDAGCRDIRHRDDCVTRPLTLLVRDGKPVTP